MKKGQIKRKKNHNRTLVYRNRKKERNRKNREPIMISKINIAKDRKTNETEIK